MDRHQKKWHCQCKQCVFPFNAPARALTHPGLSADFVKDAAQLLVMRFIPLNPSDLENWMSDPEEWVSTEDKEQEQWEYEIRVRCYVDSTFSKPD